MEINVVSNFEQGAFLAGLPTICGHSKSMSSNHQRFIIRNDPSGHRNVSSADVQPAGVVRRRRRVQDDAKPRRLRADAHGLYRMTRQSSSEHETLTIVTRHET